MGAGAPFHEGDHPRTWVGPVHEEEEVEGDDLMAKDYCWHNHGAGLGGLVEMLATNVVRICGLAQGRLVEGHQAQAASVPVR